MADATSTGTRIRERRLARQVKQADLARQAGISASYLNLIEHDRRKIAGKLLTDIAEALDVDPALLAEGAEAALVADLDAATHGMVLSDADRAAAGDFARRFPGWAQLLLQQGQRITALERTVTGLTDRLTHDPYLADNLHDMLTTVSSIHATAGILSEPDEIDAQWQRRFHRNINDDSARLAEITRTLVSYFDATASDDPQDLRVPQEEVDAVLQKRGWHIDDLEDGRDPQPIAAMLGSGLTEAARALLATSLSKASRDARALPRVTVISDLASQTAETLDPFDLAAKWQVAPDLALRRIAALARQAGLDGIGLASCDAAGLLVHRQGVAGFQLPRSGSACAMLPLYAALSQPGRAISVPALPTTRPAILARTFAYAAASSAPHPNTPPLTQAHMLIVAQPAMPRDTSDAVPVGVSCRICPREGCPGRSEPSILAIVRGA